MNRTETAESPFELCQKLRSMRLSGMADELEKQANNPNTDLIPFRYVQANS